MSNQHIVMQQQHSPIRITHPKPIASFDEKKQAEAFASEKRRRYSAADYYVVSVPANPQLETKQRAVAACHAS